MWVHDCSLVAPHLLAEGHDFAAVKMLLLMRLAPLVVMLLALLKCHLCIPQKMSTVTNSTVLIIPAHHTKNESMQNHLKNALMHPLEKTADEDSATSALGCLGPSFLYFRLDASKHPHTKTHQLALVSCPLLHASPANLPGAASWLLSGC